MKIIIDDILHTTAELWRHDIEIIHVSEHKQRYEGEYFIELMKNTRCQCDSDSNKNDDICRTCNRYCLIKLGDGVINIIFRQPSNKKSGFTIDLSNPDYKEEFIKIMKDYI